MFKLTTEFYQNPNVVAVAQQLIGKLLVTNVNNQLTSGINVNSELSYKK
ncbi:MAG: hypothetical protein KBF86_07835 [Chitinophagales bacterium]|jgi:3-methyladenine DNA glycosylase Mpg|nr:hypothetical protein [Chitinophagales bacterium]